MSASGLGIIGAGIFAREAHLPALATLGSKAPPVLAIYSHSHASAAALASQASELLDLPAPPVVHSDDPADPSLDALLKNPSITTVLILLPIPLIPSTILAALSAGKHVLSEKPVAPTAAAARALIATYRSQYEPQGLVWRVAENFEAEPAHRKAAQAIRAGKIGDVHWWTARAVGGVHESTKWYKTPWRTVPKYQGGFLLDGGVHTLAALRTVLPHAQRPTHLSAHASLVRPILAPHDTIQATLRGPGASSGTLTLAFSLPPFLPASAAAAPESGIYIVGSKGSLHITRPPSAGGQFRTILAIAGSGQEEGKELEGSSVEEWDDPSVGVEAELDAFFAAIRGEGDVEDNHLGQPENALWDVAAIEAALNSHGKEIQIDQVGLQA